MLNNKETLLKALQAFKSKILVIGDIMLDEFLWCEVSRISPEAPVPVCDIQKTTLMPGGAANVAHNIVTLGSMPYLMGVIGHDSSGNKLMHLLKKLGINTEFLIQASDRNTILKSRVIARHQHVVRVDREDKIAISDELCQQILNNLKKVIPEIKIILLSDYLKGTLPDNLIKEIIKLANQKNIPVIVDPKGYDYQKYANALLLTPNRSEFEQFAKIKIRSESDYLEYGLKIIKEANLETLIITRSEEGLSIINKAGTKIDIPTKAQEVFDITGAGDTFIAALTIGLASGIATDVAACLANFAAGVSVSKVGTATVTIEELTQSILNTPLAP